MAKETRTVPDLAGYAAILRRRWPWVAAPILLLVGVTAVASFRQPDEYRASASVLLADTVAQQTLQPSSQNPLFLSRELANEITLANSDIVQRIVTEELGQLPAVEVTAESQADVLTFVATSSTAGEAALHANTWAEAFVSVKQDQAAVSINAALENLQRRLIELRESRQEVRAPLDELDDRIARTTDPAELVGLQREYDRLADDLSYELELINGSARETASSVTELELQSELSSIGTAQIVHVAVPPDAPVGGSAVRLLLLALAVSTVLGVGLALMRDALDRTIKEPNDVRAITEIPVLASIPRLNRRTARKVALITRDLPDRRFSEEMQKVRTALQFAAVDEQVRSVLVTSSNEREGKTTTASNLAWALNTVDASTILVDVDFRRPRIHKVFGLSNVPGFADHLIQAWSLSDLANSVGDAGRLVVLTAGTAPPNPASFVGARRFAETVEALVTMADMVVLDGPPTLPVSDALTLAGMTDGVLVTVLAGTTTRDHLTETIHTLSQVNARILGIVLVGTRTSTGNGQYYQSAAREVAAGRRETAAARA